MVKVIGSVALCSAPIHRFVRSAPLPSLTGGRGAAQPRLGQAGPGVGGGHAGLPAERGCRWGVSLPARWVQPPPAPGGEKLRNNKGAAGAGLGAAGLSPGGGALPLREGGVGPAEVPFAGTAGLGTESGGCRGRSGPGFPLGVPGG